MIAVPRSVLGEDGTRSAAELEVQAGLDDASALADVEVGCQPETARVGDGPRAEIVVVVLDEAGQPIQEGIFAADAPGPATAGLAARQSDARHRREEPAVVVT